MTMNPVLSAFNHVVAFEVAKDSLVIHVLPSDKQSVTANKPKAIRKALCFLRSRIVSLGTAGLSIANESESISP